MEPHPWNSSVFQDPGNEYIKDMRVPDTLILIIEGKFLKLRLFGTWLNHICTVLAIKLQLGTSSLLYNSSSKAIKDMRVLNTLIFIQDSWNLNTRYIRILFSYSYAFLVMKPHSWTSRVLHNPDREDIKERWILDILIFIQKGWNFKQIFFGTFLYHPFINWQ